MVSWSQLPTTSPLVKLDFSVTRAPAPPQLPVLFAISDSNTQAILGPPPNATTASTSVSSRPSSSTRVPSPTSFDSV